MDTFDAPIAVLAIITVAADVVHVVDDDDAN